MIDQIKQKIAAIKKQKEELVAQLRNDFAPMLMPLFEKSNGKISSIGWTQYTPYFNDGDECVFDVNSATDFLRVNGQRFDDIKILQKGMYDTITPENYEQHKIFNSSKSGYSWYKDKIVGDSGYFPNPNYDQELYDLLSEFSSVLSSIESEFLKDLFGDHVEVTVKSDGTIETEEYEHD